MCDDNFIDEDSLQGLQNAVKADTLRDDDSLSMVEALFHGCRKKAGARAGYVTLASDDGSNCEIICHFPRGLQPHNDQRRHRPLLDSREWFKLSGRAQYHNGLCHSVSTDPAHPSLSPSNNLISVCLMVGAMPRGLLVLSDKEGAFTDQDADTVEIYAKLISMALLMPESKNLSESEGELRESLERVIDAIALLDHENDIIFSTNAFQRMFPHLEDGLGSNIAEILGLCEFPSADTRHDLFMISPEDQECHFEFFISMLPRREKSVKVLIVRDVSEKKAHERAMRLIERKMEFMGRITRHEVMNHLMVIRGFMELSYDAGAPISDKHHSRIDGALEKIKDLYVLQRELEGMGSSESEWIGVTDALSQAQESLEGADSIALQADTKAFLWADHLLKKVFYSLLHNSMTHGGLVSRITLKCEQEGGRLFLDVIDDGTGIPTDEKDSIFSLGFGKLSGQGLFLAKELLATYDMGLEEIGEFGEGAVFRISVPPGRWKER